MAARHPNKHIAAAIEVAERRGWRVEKAGPRAHSWGRLLCPESTREGCYVPVFSTPRNPQRHAQDIIRSLDRCPHT